MADLYANDDLLICYLDGELSNVEKAALEQQLQSDASLRERLMQLKVAVQAVQHLGTTEQMVAIHGDMMKELRSQRGVKVKSLSKAVRYTMAAAASLLVLFFGLRLYLAMQNDPAKLYDEAFVDFTVSTSRGVEAQPSEIEKQYAQKAYDSVIDGVRSLQLDEKDSLLIGLSFLHTNRPAQAVGFFQGLAYGESDFRQDAEFYLALGLLKNKDYRRSLPLLRKIAGNPMHLYHERVSKNLVESVEKLLEK